ncbi:hypothetical protein [Candidatus Uabimicrobium sp. HlEnr_7]|uniref:hypothetical protein n=1 Tax=Candidatus Uabimicrobium helgolandensis TaxID=3095367 RepID=UPI003556580E
MYFSLEFFEFLLGETAKNRKIKITNVHGNVQEFLEMLSYESFLKKIKLDINNKNNVYVEAYIEVD